MVERHGQRQAKWRRKLMPAKCEKDAKGLLDREENKRVDTDGDRTSKRSFVAETEGSKTEDGVLWPCDASKRYGKGYDAGMRRGKKEESRPKKKWMEENTRCQG